MDTFVGFDSAWTDSPKAPGAICAVHIEAGHQVQFEPPRLASFNDALAFIANVRTPSGVTLIALDQPTIVPNLTGNRPVEQVAASLISWLGGGVQPSNRGRRGMFCDASPIWPFLAALNAVEDPERARLAPDGLFLMEVFPALALASLDHGFFGRLSAPRYNPGRKKTFRSDDWGRVAAVAAREAHGLHCDALAEWCRNSTRIVPPRKADQDKLDAALCALIALRWRLRPRHESVLIGDLNAGYMVAPVSAAARERLTVRARAIRVPLDGACPTQREPA